MSLSNKTKAAVGREDLPQRDDLSSALGVHTSIIKQAELSKAEQGLLQTNNALTVEDNDPFFTLYEISNKNALIKPTYDPWHLATLTHQNNTLLQCVSAMEINIDGTGYAIEPLDPKNLEETVQAEIDGEENPLPDAAKEEPEVPEKPVKPEESKEREETTKAEEPEEKPKKEGKPFIPPPNTPEEALQQAEEKHAEKEQAKLEEEEKQERVQALKDEKDEIRKGIEAFFNEPWPGMSFTTIRRKIRRDVETLGNAYLEVIRNASGDIVFLNYLDAKLVRMVRLGKPIEVEQEVIRFGKESTVKTLKRERRYAMLIGSRTTVSNVTRVMYFKEFGATRNLNKWTGLWEGDGSEEVKPGMADSRIEGRPQDEVAAVPVPGLTGPNKNVSDIGGPVDLPDQATEIIHFTMLPDISTLYGVPRWINQMPSVLGSRKAEEQNLEFFESGGIPPVMILIQGGSLDDQARKALTGYMAGKSKYKQRGIIAELFSTSGDLTSAGNVRVNVERFGAERQSDAMFMKYDEQCQHHVRMSFRLPPLFIGDSKEHNFATAKASYMVAEAQVFEPERNEFDEVINTHIMKEIAPEWVYRSKTLSINDTTEQIEALELSKDVVDKECWVNSLSEIAHLELDCRHDDEEEPDIATEVASRIGLMQGQPGAVQNGEPGTEPPFQRVEVESNKFGKIEKISDDIILELADDWTDWIAGDKDFEAASVESMKLLIDSFSPAVSKIFNGYVSMRMLAGQHQDPEGTADLLATAAAYMAEKGCAKGKKGRRKPKR